MDQLNIVQRRNFSEINYMDLTYHYAFQAKMLDITSDRQTALFFAFCKDGNNHRIDVAHPNTQNGPPAAAPLLHSAKNTPRSHAFWLRS